MDIKQKERQQRGADFQEEMRRSWRLVPNCWRMRIADGRGSTRPADELIILKDINVLAEHKRTQGDRFELGFLRPNQIKGLLDFEAVNERNMGMVFVSFMDEKKGQDIAVAFRLLPAMRYMQKKKRNYITLDDFLYNEVSNLLLLRIGTDDGPAYLVKGVNDKFVNDKL